MNAEPQYLEFMEPCSTSLNVEIMAPRIDTAEPLSPPRDAVPFSAIFDMFSVVIVMFTRNYTCRKLDLTLIFLLFNHGGT
jgi:hypothetical protein